MKQSIVHVALVVRDYDEAIDFYTKKLNFDLIEDTYQPARDKRWVVVAPPGSNGTTLLLARASKPEQEPFIGNQTGGRVFLFLNTAEGRSSAYARESRCGAQPVKRKEPTNTRSTWRLTRCVSGGCATRWRM